MRRMGVIVGPTGVGLPSRPTEAKNNATGVVVATGATDANGRWDFDLADEAQAYRVEIAGASGSSQKVVQAPASIELEWLFVRYGIKAPASAVVELPTTTTIGGSPVMTQATSDTRYVNVPGDAMT